MSSRRDAIGETTTREMTRRTDPGEILGSIRISIELGSS
jgi:hypothetical protein